MLHDPPAVTVPFLDLAPVNAPVKEAFLADVALLVDTGAFTNGPQVADFERRFAAYCSAEDCIGVASGLDALRLALIGFELEPGAEVIVPANTFFATLEAVTQAGATPVPVDVSLDDYNLDVEAVSAAIGPRTKVLLPVHLYGQLADMRALLELSGRHDIAVLEDACQAHGAERDGIRAGTGGLAAAFSFYPGKNLGAFGDAGALVTSDDGLAAAVRALREHGQTAKYRHEAVGYTARLDTVQAIALIHKLPFLDEWNGQRRLLAAMYMEALGDVGDLVLPPVPGGSEPVWHLFVVRTSRRDDLAHHLRERGIATGLHYPQPSHLSPAYASLGLGRGSFPVTELLADETLSLPIFPGMTIRQLQAVVDGIEDFFRGW